VIAESARLLNQQSVLSLRLRFGSSGAKFGWLGFRNARLGLKTGRIRVTADFPNPDNYITISS
jgi:hypothetical protein